ITPFDRSDIRDLITSMDDAIDQMHKTAKAVTLFGQRRFQPDMVKLGDIIVRTADLTAEAVPLLRSLRANARRLNEITDQVTRLEGESDQLYDTGMAALYRGPARQDAMAFVVGAEIYDHLERVVDRFEDVANRISGVRSDHLERRDLAGGNPVVVVPRLDRRPAGRRHSQGRARPGDLERRAEDRGGDRGFAGHGFRAGAGPDAGGLLGLRARHAGHGRR